MNSSRPSSAQWMSSNTSTSGLRAAISSRNRRQAANASVRRSPRSSRAEVSPASGARCASIQRASFASSTTYSTAMRSFSSTLAAGSVARMPALAFTISPSAQKVTPSP